MVLQDLMMVLQDLSPHFSWMFSYSSIFPSSSIFAFLHASSQPPSRCVPLPCFSHRPPRSLPRSHALKPCTDARPRCVQILRRVREERLFRASFALLRFLPPRPRVPTLRVRCGLRRAWVGHGIHIAWGRLQHCHAALEACKQHHRLRGTVGSNDRYQGLGTVAGNGGWERWLGTVAATQERS